MAIAKILELTSRSRKSFDDAVESGVSKAAGSVHNIQSAWVKDQQIVLVDDAISEYQVTLKVTFVVD